MIEPKYLLYSYSFFFIVFIIRFHFISADFYYYVKSGRAFSFIPASFLFLLVKSYDFFPKSIFVSLHI